MTSNRARASQKRPAAASEASDGSGHGAEANGARMGSKQPPGVAPTLSRIYWQVVCCHHSCKRRLGKFDEWIASHNDAILKGWQDCGEHYRCPTHADKQ